MREDQAEAIMKKIGYIDGPGLIDKLKLIGVGENLELTRTGINIPKAIVTDISKLQSELRSLSKVGRIFEITEEEKLVINIIKIKMPFYVSDLFLFQRKPTTIQISHPVRNRNRRRVIY